MRASRGACAAGVALGLTLGLTLLGGCMAGTPAPAQPLPPLQVRTNEGEALALNWEGDKPDAWTADVSALGSVWVLYEVCDGAGQVSVSAAGAFDLTFDCDGVVGRRVVVSQAPLSQLDIAVTGDTPRWQVNIATRPAGP